MAQLVSLGDSLSHALAFCVVLLVASVPIAMRVVCNTTMALGCRRMADAGACSASVQVPKVPQAGTEVPQKGARIP